MSFSTEEVITEPADNDVLCGKGYNIYSHVGTTNFRRLIASNAEKYTQFTARSDKTNLAASLVALIQQKGGRFILKVDDHKYIEVDDLRAREKVSHALRSLRQVKAKRKKRQPTYKTKKQLRKEKQIQAKELSTDERIAAAMKRWERQEDIPASIRLGVQLAKEKGTSTATELIKLKADEQAVAKRLANKTSPPIAKNTPNKKSKMTSKSDKTSSTTARLVALPDPELVQNQHPQNTSLLTTGPPLINQNEDPSSSYSQKAHKKLSAESYSELDSIFKYHPPGVPIDSLLTKPPIDKCFPFHNLVKAIGPQRQTQTPAQVVSQADSTQGQSPQPRVTGQVGEPTVTATPPLPTSSQTAAPPVANPNMGALLALAEVEWTGIYHTQSNATHTLTR